MTIRKGYPIAIVLITAISLLATIWVPSTMTRSNSIRDTQGGNLNVFPLTLNSVQYVEHAISSPLMLPTDTSILGASYRAMGAGVISKPHVADVTGYDGVKRSFADWVVQIVLWNGDFVNGTTTNREILNNGGVVITESSSPAGVNSTRSALDRLAPPVLCRTNGASTTTTCRTITSNSGGYIVNIRGLAVIVYPEGHTVIWLNDKTLRWFEITSETVGIDQLLTLARSIIP